MKCNTVAVFAGSIVFAASVGFALSDDKTEKQDRKLSATDIAREWQPPRARDAQVLRAVGRNATTRLTVDSPLKDVWQFYARMIGYQGNKDFSAIEGVHLDPQHVIISERNRILVIHHSDHYTVHVRIPRHDGKVTKGVRLTIGTRP